MTEILDAKEINIRETYKSFNQINLINGLNMKVRYMETKWIKYAAIFIIAGAVIGIYYPDKTFLTFVTTWLFIIPAIAIIYLIYGLIQYLRDRKNKIIVTMKSNDITERLISIIHQEEELKREKDALYKQIKNGVKER